MKVAERRAEKATAKTNDLITAYKCPDCGRFHIGHPDLSQKLAFQVHVDRGCLRCGGPIHEALRQKAKRWGWPSLYCSPACRKLAARQRRQAKRSGTGHGDSN
jgi:hypothetical protein